MGNVECALSPASGSVFTLQPAINAIGVCGSEKIQAYFYDCTYETCDAANILEEDLRINVSSNNCLSVNFSGITGPAGMMEAFLGGAGPLNYAISASSTT